MRGKRAKQYRKLMRMYETTFGFHPPYQILVDADTIRESIRFKMDLAAALKRTVQNDVKPMISQCCIRHLYDEKPQNKEAIALAKTLERRRCGHHELETPLSESACLSQVVDPKDESRNKHRLLVATHDQDLRAHFRTIPGVPLIYITRSMMLLEPVSEMSEKTSTREERQKFRVGLKPKARGQVLGKRARDENGEAGEVDAAKKKRAKGIKGPNPLSMMKPKRRKDDKPRERFDKDDGLPEQHQSGQEEKTLSALDGEKRKRKRKSSKRAGEGEHVPSIIAQEE